MENKIFCCKCQEMLTSQKVRFSYLGCDFNVDMLKCPGCGQVFIPKDIVEEKMANVEQALEGK